MVYNRINDIKNEEKRKEIYKMSKKCGICDSPLVKKNIVIFSETIKLEEESFEVQFLLEAEYCSEHNPSQEGDIITQFSDVYNLNVSIRRFYEKLNESTNLKELQEKLSQTNIKNIKLFKKTSKRTP